MALTLERKLKTVTRKAKLIFLGGSSAKYFNDVITHHIS